MSNMALALTLSNVNPFTYRGYCYDFDIEMYYLQSRYYDPKICRFINADSTDYLGATGTLLSYNLFAYCENDAVDFVDERGFFKCYAFSIPKNMSIQTFLLKSSKQVVKMKVTNLKIVKHNKNFKQYETINASHATIVNSSSSFYIDYRYRNVAIYSNDLDRALFYKKTYQEWLLYIEYRHRTIFDYVEDKAKKALKMDDDDWQAFTDAISYCDFPPQYSFVQTGLELFDILSYFLKLITKWLDKIDNYILYCLKSFDKLKKSNTKIAILWKVQHYQYCFANSGTGYRKDWHLIKTYWAYKY